MTDESIATAGEATIEALRVEVATHKRRADAAEKARDAWRLRAEGDLLAPCAGEDLTAAWDAMGRLEVALNSLGAVLNRYQSFTR